MGLLELHRQLLLSQQMDYLLQLPLHRREVLDNDVYKVVNLRVWYMLLLDTVASSCSIFLRAAAISNILTCAFGGGRRYHISLQQFFDDCAHISIGVNTIL